MSDPRWRNFGLVLKKALRMPFPVIVLMAGVLFTLISHNFTGLAIFVVAVVVYVLLKLRDEQFIRDTIHEASSARHADDVMTRTFQVEQLDEESRIRMKAIIRLHDEIAHDVQTSQVDAIATGLAGTIDQTQELVGRALELSQSRRDLLRYLRATDEQSIETRIGDAESRLQDEPDESLRAQIQTGIKARQRELDDYRAIEQAAGRILDQLDAVQSSFAGLRARLVRVKSTDIADWVAANNELQVQIGSLNIAVDAVEQSVSEVLNIGHSE
ncbi:MAG: hypothetical protein ABFD54_02285 [Armatimonadota bacterium]|nr:hypothetical protein [bacterium]